MLSEVSDFGFVRLIRSCLCSTIFAYFVTILLDCLCVVLECAVRIVCYDISSDVVVKLFCQVLGLLYLFVQTSC